MTTTLSPLAAGLKCAGHTLPLGLDELWPALSWELLHCEAQSAYRIQAATSLDLLQSGQADLWDSGQVTSAAQTAVRYGGKALQSRQRVFWRVQVWDQSGATAPAQEVGEWEMGLLSPQDWKAQWIGRPGIIQHNYEAPVRPAPYLRHQFQVENAETVTSARLYVSGLGYSETFLNSAKVGDRVLDPIVSQYDKSVGYTTYDVTGQIQAGANVVGAVLGNGWYNCSTNDVWHFDKASWRDYPKLLLQLELTHSDGTVQQVVSNSEWMVGDGPITFDALRNGETYDARLEQNGWTGPDFDAADWKHAAVVAGPGGQLFAQCAPPCRVVDTIAPESWTEVKPGVWLFNFGQNIAGWGLLQVEAPAGTEITLIYAEKVTEEGVDQANINNLIKSGDCQTDRYIAAGHGLERFEPHFTYHGFQWVEVHGLPTAPTAQTLQARIVQTDMATAGGFESSDATLNELQKLTRRSYISNFVGIPTDCPHREKNGWTGDAQLAIETALFNYAGGTAYKQWLRSVTDVQRPSGQLPGIVPSSGWGFNWGNGPAWDSALIVIPWQLYVFTGDSTLLERHYGSMKQLVEFTFNLTDDGLVRYGLGDWIPPKGVTTSPRDLATTAILMEECRIMARVAELLGHEGDVASFHEKGAALRSAWRAAYLGENGSVAGNEQTSLACALYFDFLEEEEKPAVLEQLVKAVDAAGGHPAFGILGAKWVTRVLAEHGYAHLAYRMIVRPEYPSWAHWLTLGATSLWEDWEGNSSRNHIMFGDISAWMYTYLAGIRPLEEHPAFAAFEIRPTLVDGLDWARGWHQSPRGIIKSEWRREGDGVRCTFTVPQNSVAHFTAPGDTSAPVDGESRRRVEQLGPGEHSFFCQ